MAAMALVLGTAGFWFGVLVLATKASERRVKRSSMSQHAATQRAYARIYHHHVVSKEEHHDHHHSGPALH